MRVECWGGPVFPPVPGLHRYYFSPDIHYTPVYQEEKELNHDAHLPKVNRDFTDLAVLCVCVCVCVLSFWFCIECTQIMPVSMFTCRLFLGDYSSNFTLWVCLKLRAVKTALRQRVRVGVGRNGWRQPSAGGGSGWVEGCDGQGR